jgi:hypothetical protein
MRALKNSCGLLLAVAALSQTPPESASVSGAVVDGLTGAPLPRAHVALRGTGPSAKNYGAVTAAEGKFSIAGIVPGVYQGSAERAGFYTPSVEGSTTTKITLNQNDKNENLKFQLKPLGTISGRVLDADGAPMESARVTINTGQDFSSAADSTDDKGRFKLVGIQPGRYRVKASVVSALATPPEIRTDGTVEARYIPTYFGGGTEFESAARVEVGAGAEVNGIEIRLARAPMMHITGRVVGLPPGEQPTLWFSQTTGARSRCGMKEDGTFLVWNVDPGKYLFSAMLPPADRALQVAPLEVEVGLLNIDGIELRALPPSDVSGRIDFEDAQARPQPPPQNGQAQPGNSQAPTIELRTVDPGPVLPGAPPTKSEVAADGAFHITGVTARRFRVMLSWPTAYVKSVTLGSNRVEGNVLNLRNGAAGASVTVVVSSTFGAISGTVSDDDGPAPGARVALVRDDFVSVGDVTFVYADGLGAYSIPNVRPGAYRIAAIEDTDNGPRAGNLDDYKDVLAAIEVRPNEKIVKDLKRRPPVK